MNTAGVSVGNGGGRCQLQGQIVIQIGNPAEGRVNGPIDPVNGREGCVVQGGFVIQIKNFGNEAVAPPINLEGGDQPQADEQELVDDSATTRRHLDLYQAAVKGDWEAAQNIYKRHQVDVNAPITSRGETVLHIAALAEQTHFVAELVNEMSDEGLNLRDIDNNTALCFAAVTGKKEIAEAMIERKQDLAMERGREEMLPLYIAALLGRSKDMVSYLYQSTKHKLETRDCEDLIVALIDADMYDVALDMITGGREHVVSSKDRHGETALHALARKPYLLSNISPQSRSSESRTNCFNLFSSSNKPQKKNPHQSARDLAKFICDRVALLNDREIADLIGKDWRPIFVAAEKGNLEFLRILIRSFPDLVFKTNDHGQTIFHTAVVNRHEEIFKLIHEIGSFKNVIALYKDKDDNTMLHLAGMLAPPHQLNIVPGAALQLQRELLWFEEVRKVVGPRLAEAKNIDKKTPDELFMEKHEDLIKKGEEWMRNTANSCLIVATLVATVVFAAAFTVPGGNDQNTGFPMFLNRTLFKIFAISDAISLIFSASSVLTFLSVLTSTYALEDFVRSLPAKLLIGLSTLFISIVAMMVAFVTVFFAYFKQEKLLLRYAVPVAVVAFVPICLFIGFHYRLFVSVVKSTCKSKFNSPFRPNYRDPLFPAARTNKDA